MTNRPKKICFVSVCAYGLFRPESGITFGGAEVQMYQIATRLARNKDMDVHFIVYHSGGKAVEHIEGVNVHALCSWPARSKILRGLSLRLSFLLRLWRIGADVYVQRAAGIETGITSLFCRLARKKFVYSTAHRMDIDGDYRKMYPIAGIIYEIGLRCASRIVVQNHEDRSILKRHFKRGSIVLKNSFHIPEDSSVFCEREYILWVGRCVEWKRPEIVLLLAKIFPKQDFLMILPNQDERLWVDISKQASIMTNVHIVERVPFGEIDEYFKKAKIFINTSDYEGFPNTFIQAAMYGVPILSLNVNPDDFLDEYDCGACAEGDEKKLAEQMKDLLDNTDLWDRQSHNARKYVEENHDIEKNMHRFRDILRD